MSHRAAILAIFVLSGLAGLVYEIVWSRQLVLVFGNTTQAVSAILTGFFGGMAIGAALGGRVADRVRSPLRMYGILEIALVVVVLVTPITFGIIREVYRSAYPTLEGAPQLLALVRLVLAVVALGPATVMMGATFPSLTRYLARSSTLSGAFGRLYAANTIGAIGGTLLAGLVLIEVLGLSGALAAGAACSLVAGLTALALDRRASAPAGATDTREAATRLRSTTVPRVHLALVIAFVSGLTSLGYQVTWTRLLASGTGNTTYVFTVILAIFLAGIAVGSLLFNIFGSRLRDPVRALAYAQAAVAVLAIAGLVWVIGQPEALDPGRPLQTIGTLIGSAFLVVFPVTVTLGVAFPTASALLRDEAAEAGTESGSLLAVNTTGAILGSLLIPFVLMPLAGSPTVVVLLAAANGALAIALALVSRPRSIAALACGAGALAIVLVAAFRPGAVVQPNEALIAARGGALFDSVEDEIASVQAGQIRSTPELWVAGTSMTLLTVDAKLMPILPLVARPGATRALVVAFGMGTAYRAALIAGLRTDAVELVPSVPRMFGHYYDDAAAVLADPAGRVIVTDGRNHLELTDEHFDIIVTDPPPPIESSGASVISSLEYYEAGRDHLAPGGVMMQWVPYGAPEAEFKEHIRTFAAAFPEVEVIRGAGGYGVYMLGSEEPLEFDADAVRAVLARPGVLEDISSAYDSPARTVDDWVEVVGRQRWLDDDGARAYAGDGPLITDDHPRPEYFLLRRLTDGVADR
jgi:spermidine synthase